ncbi:hypothetical protein, partial [Thalassotalea ganghwensis]
MKARYLQKVKKLRVGFFGVLTLLNSLTIQAIDVNSGIDVSEYTRVLDPVFNNSYQNAFSDGYNPANGQLAFEVTDISIPGNSALPVNLSRWISGDDLDNNGPHGWQWNVPMIQGHFLAIRDGHTEPEGWDWGTNNWHYGNNCSGGGDSVIDPQGNKLFPSHYWNGKYLHIPGKTSERFLIDDEQNQRTKSNYKVIECINNANNQEGIIVQGPDGTKYTFNEIQTYENGKFTFKGPVIKTRLLLVTKVEDKFGNYVNYNWVDGALKSITANDGRQITIEYEDFSYGKRDLKRPTSATSGTRTWTYEYNSDSHFLEYVILPDGQSKWEYDRDIYFTKFNPNDFNAGYTTLFRQGTMYTPAIPSCNFDDSPVTTSVKTPEGLSIDFTFKRVRFGRSQVDPVFYQPLTNQPGDNSQNVRNLHCSIKVVLISKTIKNTGSTDLTWAYSYSDNQGNFKETANLDGKIINDYLTGPFKLAAPSGGFPDNINSENAADFRSVTIQGPENKEIYFIDRKFASASEGSVVAKQIYDLNDDLMSTEVYEFLAPSETNYVGKHWGATGPSSEDGAWSSLNANMLSHRINQVASTTYYYEADNATTTYVVEDKSYNDLGALTSMVEYSAATKKRFHYYQYRNDDVNGVINLPTKTFMFEEAKSDQQLTGLTAVSETTYQTVNFTDAGGSSHAVLMPDEQKSFGVWQKQFSEYHTTQGTYQQLGQVKKVEYNQPLVHDASQNVYQLFENYKRGQAQKISVPKRRSSGTEYVLRTIDNNGWVTSTTDFNGNKTEYGYDDLGRIQYIKAPDKAGEVDWADTFFTWSHDGGIGANQPVRKVERCTLNVAKTACSDTALMTETTTYDGLLRPVLVKTEDGITGDGSNTVYQNNEYNAYNKLTFQSFPSSSDTETSGTTYSYDGLQRLISQSITDGGTVTTEYLAGNKIKVTDAGKNTEVKNNEQHSTTTTYLAYGSPSYEQAIKIESPESVTTTIDINLYGNINSITQAGNRDGNSISATEYRYYNDEQQLCAVKRDDVGSTVYHRNNLGQVEWQAEGQSLTAADECNTAVADSDKVTFTYDNLGAIYQTSFGDNTPTRTYSYDNNGNITSIVGAVSQSYTYNAINLLESESLVVDGKTFGLDYGYSKLGHLASLTYPDSVEVPEPIEFAPNGFGQATQAIRTYQDTSKGTDTFVEAGAKYHVNGMVDTFTYGNGLTHKTSLNDRLMPQQIRDYKTGTDAVNLTYSYDNNANITSITNGRAADLSTLSALTYDGLNRLTSTTGEQGSHI